MNTNIKSGDYKYTIHINDAIYYSDETLTEFINNIAHYKDIIFTICFNIQSMDGGSISIKVNNYYDQKLLCMKNNVCIDNITACNCRSISDIIIDNKCTLNMIYTAISYVTDLCPWLTKINLCDYRKNICRKGEATPGMLLSCYYIALTGKTWYETYLHAELENINHKIKYNNYIKLFNSGEYKCDWYNLNINLYQFGLQQSINFDIIEIIYKSTITYSEFFNKLKEKIIDTNEFYKTLEMWLEMFMKLFIFETNLDLLNNTWIFNVSNIPKMNYTIESCNDVESEYSSNGYIII